MPVKAYRVIDVVYDHQESFNLSETGVSRENCVIKLMGNHW